MKKMLHLLGCALSWLAAALLSGAELSLIWLWAERSHYVEQFGAAENLYAAEEAWTAGFLAFLLAVPLLLTLLLALFCTKTWREREQNCRENTVADP